MKKLALLAGLAGILATGAMAQSSGVTLSVGQFRQFTFSAGTLAFNITDGGFNGPYDTNNRGYNVVANTGWSLTSALSPVDVDDIMPAGSNGDWEWAATLTNVAGGAGNTNPGNAYVTLSSADSGHYIGPGNFTATGTLTVTIAP